MIARWMLAAIVFAACSGLVALAAERALRALRWPTRWPWVLALVVALVWPAVSAVRPVPALRSSTPLQLPAAIDAPLEAPALVPGKARVDRSKLLDRWLLALWLIASGSMLVRVGGGLHALHRAKAHARTVKVNGQRVLVSESLGPAVLGVRDPRIVVPEWLLGLDAGLRSLVLRHEREHCEARDPALVWAGAAATVLMPWNAALWWLSRRLRLAMEIDCDARTMRGESDHTTYARLLLLIAQRQTAARLAPMLAESSSHLSRRIAAMRSNPVKHRVLKGALLVAAAGAAIVVACSPRLAGNLTGPAPEARPASAATEVPRADTATVPQSAPDTTGKPLLDFQVQRPATLRPGTKGPAYPAEARAAGVQGSVLAQFVVNTDGDIETGTFKVLHSDNAMFSTAVREALPTLKFVPAENKGAKVRQLVQAPFSFRLNGSANDMRPAESTRSTAMMPMVEPVRAGTAKLEGALRRAASVAPAPDSTQPYHDFQVTKPVSMAAGTVGPKYPDILRSAGIEGVVLAQFVVNTEGRVEMNTYKSLKSDNKLFEDAVKEALADMQFTRAELNGTPVKQIVQQPFQFALRR